MQGLKHAVAGWTAAPVCDQHRLVHQRRHHLHDAIAGQVVRIAADLLDRVQGGAPREHRQAAEQRALGVIEKVPAPFDHRLQRLLARRRRSITAAEHSEPIVEPVGERFESERADPGCGELQRERDAVQMMADLCDRLHIFLCYGEVTQRGLRTFQESLHGFRLRKAVTSQVCQIGRTERWDEINCLSRNAQRLAARGQDV